MSLFASKTSTRQITVISVFGALSAALMFFEFPVPLMPPFIKFDFSDLPILIVAFAYGPLQGVLTCLIKNIIHVLFYFGNSFGIGELSNLLIAAVFCFAAGLIYRRHKTRKGALAGALAGALISALFSVIANFFIIYPLYAKFIISYDAILGMYKTILPSVHNLLSALLIFNLPFTFLKNLVIAAICFFIYKPLHPILKGGRRK